MPSSKTKVAPVSATPLTNNASRAGVPVISGKWPPNADATSGKPSPRTSDPSPEASSVAAKRPPRSLSLGSSPISIVPRPNMPTVPSSVIAEMAVDP